MEMPIQSGDLRGHEEKSDPNQKSFGNGSSALILPRSPSDSERLIREFNTDLSPDDIARITDVADAVVRNFPDARLCSLSTAPPANYACLIFDQIPTLDHQRLKSMVTTVLPHFRSYTVGVCDRELGLRLEIYRSTVDAADRKPLPCELPPGVAANRRIAHELLEGKAEETLTSSMRNAVIRLVYDIALWTSGSACPPTRAREDQSAASEPSPDPRRPGGNVPSLFLTVESPTCVALRLDNPPEITSGAIAQWIRQNSSLALRFSWVCEPGGASRLCVAASIPARNNVSHGGPLRRLTGLFRPGKRIREAPNVAETVLLVDEESKQKRTKPQDTTAESSSHASAV